MAVLSLFGLLLVINQQISLYNIKDFSIATGTFVVIMPLQIETMSENSNKTVQTCFLYHIAVRFVSLRYQKDI